MSSDVRCIRRTRTLFIPLKGLLLRYQGYAEESRFTRILHIFAILFSHFSIFQLFKFCLAVKRLRSQMARHFSQSRAVAPRDNATSPNVAPSWRDIWRCWRDIAKCRAVAWRDIVSRATFLTMSRCRVARHRELRDISHNEA